MPTAAMPDQELKAADGDDDGDAGEHHGAAGRIDGGDDRGLGVFTHRQVLAEAADDEQGVVDADAETDHGRQRGAPRSGTSTTRRIKVTRRETDAETEHAVPSGSPMAMTEPKATSSTMTATNEARWSRLALDLLLGRLGMLAAELDLQAGFPTDLDGVDHRFGIGPLQVLHVEADGHEPGADLSGLRSKGDGGRRGRCHRGHVAGREGTRWCPPPSWPRRLAGSARVVPAGAWNTTWPDRPA